MRVVLFALAPGVVILLVLLVAAVWDRRREYLADLHRWTGRDAGLDILQPYIASSPTLRYLPTPEQVDTAERAGEFAQALTAALTACEAHTYGTGRHRSPVPQDRDPRLVALLTKTAEFDAEFLRMVEQLELPLEAS